MSGPQSGRRPELRNEKREDERRHDVPHGEGRPFGPGGPRDASREEMKSANADEPVSHEEGRCRSCGEEILPVPT